MFIITHGSAGVYYMVNTFFNYKLLTYKRISVVLWPTRPNMNSRPQFLSQAEANGAQPTQLCDPPFAVWSLNGYLEEPGEVKTPQTRMSQ